jgi:membrane associated rhomboid family serine protease
MGHQPLAFLLETDRSEEVVAVQHALTAAGVPYHTDGTTSAPRVVFFVPYTLLAAAQRITTPLLIDGIVPSESDFEAVEEPERPDLAMVQHFPWGPVKAVASVALTHLALVLGAYRLRASGFDLIRWGGISPDSMLNEPWRVITSLFLHSTPSHAFWNAVSMLVFAVPMIGYVGYARTAAIYLVAGTGGAMSAWYFSEPATLTIGSSGAVAGLFGAWIVWTIRRAPRGQLSWRYRIRTLGIALLVLPSLLSPTSSSGNNISISSHLGGLLTGMFLGALISGTLLSLYHPRPKSIE